MPKLASAPASTPSAEGPALGRYHDKRDFTATNEPRGRSGRGTGSSKTGGARFVIQKHDARRLHYDLRLEMVGVLKSWAVTRGPSLVPGEKRLAVHVEDHPLDYAGYEGVIPQGSYGAGTVIVWDRGTWRAEGNAHADYARGRLTFDLDGERLHGRFHLVRTKPRAGKEQWLLIKSADEHARPPEAQDVLEEFTDSVMSARSNADLAAGGVLRADHAKREQVAKKRAPAPRKAAAVPVPGARKAILPAFVEPCLATLSEKAPSGARWLHEIKLDGYRIQARIEGRDIRLLTRSGLDWTERFAPLAKALAALRAPSALLDGEIVVEDSTGISRFSDLQADLSAGRSDRFAYHLFDCLYLDGRDLRGATLRDRKAALATLLEGASGGGPLRLSEHMDEDGPAMARHACRMGLEGIVSKRADRPYRSGRGGDWLKIKCSTRQELVIAGYLPSTVARQRVGSLVLGVQRDGALVHVGRAGTGFTDAVAHALWSTLQPLARKDPPFATRLPPEATRGGVRWVEPRLVAEVEIRGWTGDGSVRHAAYKGLREDKAAAEVQREGGVTTTRRAKGAGTEGGKPAGGTEASVHLTHPDRVLWPEIGLTKQGLADFYESIADHVLPHVVDRPLSLVRCPDGTAKACFFQKHAWAGLDAKTVRRVPIDGEEYLAIRDLKGLLALVQASCLEIHPWGSRLRTLEKPDRIIFDLDPGPGVGWSDLVQAGLLIRDRLADLGLAGFAKTSGGKGLHVVASLKPRAEWDEAKAFAEQVSVALEKEMPERFVAKASKQARKGRIFVDYLRNGRGQTAVAAFSTRARAGAPVSTPVTWEELPLLTAGDQFRVETLPGRLSNLPRDPWHDFAASARPLPALKPRATRAR